MMTEYFPNLVKEINTKFQEAQSLLNKLDPKKSTLRHVIIKIPTVSSPGWCGSVDWAPACEPKCRWFGTQSGDMPGLQARFPGYRHMRGNHMLMFLSLSSSFPSPLSKKTNL